MSTHPVMTNALVEAPPNRAFDRYEPTELDTPDPVFGRWPWWTPICALALGLAVVLPLVIVVDPFDVPFGATIGEGLFVGVMLGAAYVLARRFGEPGAPTATDLGLRATPARAAVGWVIVARIACGIFAAMYTAAVGHVTPNAPVRVTGHVDTLDRVDLVIAVLVLAPFCEELFFRGFLYGALRGRLPVFWAALVSGGLFGALHPVAGAAAWNLVPVLVLAGITMCLLYERTGSLWPAISFHAVMNIGVLYLVTDSIGPPLYVLVGAAALFLLAPWRWFSRPAPGPRRQDPYVSRAV